MFELSTIYAAFERYFGKPPTRIARAPGRVNLIGEHTDYNDGFVFPMALDRATYVAARPRDDRIVRVFSVKFRDEDQFDLDHIVRDTQRQWVNYIRGVAKGLLARDLPLRGADLLIDSDVPSGSGLSSSAALEVAVGYTFQLLNQINLLGEELALLAQGAEHSFVGVKCGIMDQLIAALGEAGHALLIDCRDLSYRPIPIPTGVRVVVCDSGVRHRLAGSEYNQRRAGCEEAVRILRPALGKIQALRDVRSTDLAEYGHLLPPELLPLVRHVVSENERTLAAADALAAGDVVKMGQLMVESHQSLRDDYCVSIAELDTLVDLALAAPGCYGSRMTGGGFGGSTVSLVEAEKVDEFVAAMIAGYAIRTGRTLQPLVCTAGAGVSCVYASEEE
ncbi:galactokinase [Chloroflexus aggregans]|uniref:Galactokinase n=1 Tax=Chloroflexus aggregans (strain MD-66 / DSM 9485) TaxID=326427 RepID=GAL1_CHLAD|nr:galactokinase [Chloroflexus aggregans]B8GCS2.1 RecName: Full=Galactokinase; AltName: Full=Galactose kinase [Chloroflexus aggregans DSM 9485]ACL23122.1 galactokinase [Chloroflexus aggregans DSM 9485]